MKGDPSIVRRRKGYPRVVLLRNIRISEYLPSLEIRVQWRRVTLLKGAIPVLPS